MLRSFCNGNLVFFPHKHHEEMDKQNAERRKEFKEHELEKEHERREKLKKMDEEARKKEDERYKEHQEKIANATRNLHHPVRVFYFYFNL